MTSKGRRGGGDTITERKGGRKVRARQLYQTQSYPQTSFSWGAICKTACKRGGGELPQYLVYTYLLKCHRVLFLLLGMIASRYPAPQLYRFILLQQGQLLKETIEERHRRSSHLCMTAKYVSPPPSSLTSHAAYRSLTGKEVQERLGHIRTQIYAPTATPIPSKRKIANTSRIGTVKVRRELR